MKLFIGVGNSQTTVPADFHWSWEEMEKPYDYVKVRFTKSDSVIRNNRMIRDFLRSDCDVFIKMDIDQVYPKDYFTVMVPLVEKYKVIGPLIHNKWRRNDYVPLLSEKNTFPIVRVKKRWAVEKNGILKIPYSHANLFCLREVLENITPPWCEVKYRDDNCALTINKDFAFADKILKQGYDIFINTNMEVGHLVEETVNAETHKRWIESKRG